MIIKDYATYKNALNSLYQAKVSNKVYGDILYAVESYKEIMWLDYAWGRYLDWMRRIIF